MYRISFSLSMLLILLLFTGTTQAADAPGSNVEYSADSYMETEKMTRKEKVYHTANKERREVDTGRGPQITITRGDRNVTWTLMPSRNMYVETPGASQSAGVANMLGHFAKFEKSEIVGDETLDGIETTKSKIVVSSPKGNKFGGFMWVTKEGIQIKTDAISVNSDKGTKMRIKTELKNLKIGKQDPGLFEVPAGYSKMGMGGFGPGGTSSKDMIK